jgi:hypothetical protein
MTEENHREQNIKKEFENQGFLMRTRAKRIGVAMGIPFLCQMILSGCGWKRLDNFGALNYSLI